MSFVFNICITSKFGDKMQEVSSIDALSNQGIVNDRYFNKNNTKDVQVTLIESENIDYYNKLSGTNFHTIDFRRNIITKDISLNKLVGKEIKIGKVKMKVHRLCDPCKYLQDLLNDKDLVKKLLNRGGLRCEILSDGKISVNDKITILE
ncbi:MAG: sulfurase [Pelagibacteraceae bacterium]|nr:sulfurase [Pelagibacteraceae bacterium]|tara:strand:+ start:32692 stop:33138 length:447 start_codon:yes stop_codon:yes gene_type:complete